MSIYSALYASSSGMDAYGDAISVIGDNVANANTNAYKAGYAQFASLLDAGIEGESTSAGPVIGSGVRVTDVYQNHAEGSIETTQRSLDVSISGSGLFAVGSAEDPSFTRTGSFIIDANGLLATTNGDNVLGYTGADTTTLGTIDMLSVDVTGIATTEMSVTGNLEQSSPIATPPENPTTFAEIRSAASFVGNVAAVDSAGGTRDVILSFFKSAAGDWTVQAHVDGSQVEGGTEGVPVQLGEDATLTFATTGFVDDENAAAATITATPAFSGGVEAGNFTIDLSNFSQFATQSTITTVVQDGRAAGQIVDYEITTDGTINALLNTGSVALIGSLPVAAFNNYEGLKRQGSSIFADTDISGAANLVTAGTNGVGGVEAGTLENSNVDLADQFTDLIMYQRAYSAASKLFTAAGDIARDTINIIR